MSHDEHLQVIYSENNEQYRNDVIQMNEYFRRFSHKAAEMVGSPWSFVVAFAIIILWALTGPIFHFSDTWQLVINTSTTIITFLMVFLIQNTQNRDAKALHLKLDELIKSVEKARNNLVDLEDLSDEELLKLEEEFRLFREQNSPIVEELEAQALQNESS